MVCAGRGGGQPFQGAPQTLVHLIQVDVIQIGGGQVEPTRETLHRGLRGRRQRGRELQSHNTCERKQLNGKKNTLVNATNPPNEHKLISEVGFHRSMGGVRSPHHLYLWGFVLHTGDLFQPSLAKPLHPVLHLLGLLQVLSLRLRNLGHTQSPAASQHNQTQLILQRVHHQLS